MDLATSIGTLVANLNVVRNNATDAQLQQKLGALLSEVLLPLWDAALNQQLSTNTPQYQAATAQLNTATQAAQAAQTAMGQTAQAIQVAVTAAKAVDQVVGTVLPILALL